ncbi:hypothetical protein [Intestinirhabdus alba]|uniref:Uncharacterized protein n=1 Tax=Intestinirhabdus alba TaxID=2899544 RepID=A0A6L6ISD3_9ENTR|nr:hypothetical protein [Intestinirhabdus alba]MTH48638.1 hypothetical protein [Intestinirhabdus alba]
MPVWLDAIPEKAAKVQRPDLRRWLLLLLLIVPGGAVLTFWNWTADRSGFVFWYTALGLPFCLWGLLFSLRRFAYKAEQVGADSRNRERSALLGREIRRGQRCAWILGSYVQHAAGNKPGALMQAISRGMPVMENAVPRGGGVPVRYAALTHLHADPQSEILPVIATLAARVQSILETLPKPLPCALMLECSDDICQNVAAQLKSQLALRTGRTIRLLSGKGLAAFDAWLDRRWEEPGILIAVALSLPAQPRRDDADAVALLVLSNRKTVAWPEANSLHRPEAGKEASLAVALRRALLWADIAPQALGAGWSTGPLPAQGSGWNQACEENGVTFSLSEDNRSIDSVLGYAGRAAPWMAIALADASYDELGPQAIAAQPDPDEDTVWVTVIGKRDASKEIQGNE